MLAGAGIGAWYSYKSNPDQGWLKFIAPLALPWFCTAPIILIFSFIGFSGIIKGIVILPSFPIWLQALAIELLLVGVGSILWMRGKSLEALAQNPLQGGVLEAVLRERQRK